MSGRHSAWGFWIILAAAALFLYLGIGGKSQLDKLGALAAGAVATGAAVKGASTSPAADPAEIPVEPAPVEDVPAPELPLDF